ncbi:G-protein coupled receptor dmsr-1-like [Biomphalaria glabrata]|uniref:G-protein coupled receptor dmsr-1-like n=2 Tax=Biomphalaria glabrata TaxID=6526 RepID=A0A9W2YPG4_BIOGL|nr:G-protein coupled receptor dmsr-1-like [Biomphalaria glabrata]XP_055864571.1 G-protein coupled receptor dmsr-1-like [Biomphalaria glabrata]XP_055864572.1 G-protein coupled receptor dmsr-1-like [Biomphalaria glabrata]
MELCDRDYNSSSNYSASTLLLVSVRYRDVHCYPALVICIYGVITNVINIIVLTKPSMRNSINCILTGIAVADMITMSSSIPFTYYYYIMDEEAKLTSLPWLTFLAVHMNLTLISHTSSLWLGVIMAVMRYFFVRPTARGAKTLESRSTIIVIIATFLGTVLLIIPNCLATEVVPCHNNETGKTNWHLKVPSFGQNDGNVLHTVNFFIYAVMGKIIPCTLITFFGGLLLHTLKVANKRTRRLKGENATSNTNSQTRRTTVMLLAIIALYIISELPQSILILLCIFVDGFFREVYALLGDFIDLLALINSATNFITYIAMSTQYRNTLLDISCACVHRTTCKKCGHTSALQSTKYSKTPPAPV